jgi:hypothetical protein
MKKLIAVLAIVLMLFGIAFAADWVKGSGNKTASAAIYSGEGVLEGVIVTTNGSDAVTLNIYDNASAASGTKLIPPTVITSSTIDRIQAIKIPGGAIRFYNGVYVETSCSSTYNYVVYYFD